MNAPAPRDSLTNGRTPSALPLGTRLGEFELKKVLGIGGFGIVYLAFDHLLEREVAVKEYMPQSLVDRTATMHVSLRSSSDADVFAAGLKSFVNEARLLAHFNHASLLKVHRFWEANGTAYMAMPMYRGRTLKEVADSLGQAPAQAWLHHVLAPLLEALELMHREGVYHRDISPDNILIEDDGNPVLLDFGAARRVIADRSQNLTAILKPSYAPIEQYAETSAIKQGPWTDLYALGATLHFLLLGKPPPPSTTRSIHDEMLPLAQQPLQGISLAFLSAIDWMLRPRPADRPASVAVAREALEGRIAVPPESEKTVIARSPAPAPAAARGAGDDEAEDEMTVTRPLAEPLPPTQFVPRKQAPPITTSQDTTRSLARGATQQGAQTTQPRTQPTTQQARQQVTQPSPRASVSEPVPAPGLADDDVTVVVQRQPRAMPAARGSRRRSSAAAARRVPKQLGLAIGGGAILVALFWWVLQRPAAQPAAPALAEAASAAQAAALTSPGSTAASAVSPTADAGGTPAAALASGTAVALPPATLSGLGSMSVPGGAARAAATPASVPQARSATPAKTAVAGSAPPGALGTPAPASTTLGASPSGNARPASAQAPGPAAAAAAAPVPHATGAAGDGPRARCGTRTFLALFSCMREECARPQWREHAECAQWRPDARPTNPDSQ